MFLEVARSHLPLKLTSAHPSTAIGGCYWWRIAGSDVKLCGKLGILSIGIQHVCAPDATGHVLAPLVLAPFLWMGSRVQLWLGVS